MSLDHSGDNDWNQITRLLGLASQGDAAAQTELYEQVYRDLRGVAGRLFSLERGGASHTLQPTALVHEAFLRLSMGATVEYKDRVHFFAVAARQMRRILVDHARSRQADKRGGGDQTVTLTLVGPASQGPAGKLDLLDVDRALDELGALDERTARVVDLRFFGGLTEEETAQALGVSAATVRADWKFARGWLVDRMAAPVTPQPAKSHQPPQ